MPKLVRGHPVVAGIDYQTNFAPVTHYRTARAVSKELELSSGHYGFPGLLGSRNVGGAFALRGADTVHSPSPYTTHWRGGPNDQYYKGSFFANIANYAVPSFSARGESGMGYGAEAFSKLKPTQPEFSALNSMYELREFPDLWRADYHRRGLRGVADYNLAIQFGWIPLLSDLRRFVNLQQEAQRRLKQLLRDNGRPVRRKTILRNESTPGTVTTGRLYGALQPVLVTQYYVSQPNWTLRTGSTDRVWASARMKYWLPDGPRDIEYKRRLMRALYGFRVTPDVIYNMIPWSWLVDWFSNLGDLIGNLDYAGVADRLAAEYMYIMRHKEWYSEYTAQGQFRKQNGDVFSVTASARSRSYTKTRVRGGPFDLALKENNLSATQLGILGALGLSRMPNWSI